MISPRFHAQRDGDPGSTVIAVDLGYSSTKRTCGIATDDGTIMQECTFGDCVIRTADLLNTRPFAILVVEAVLSTRHDPKLGNPSNRGEFEKARGWYCQPGVVTYAAALRFLDQVAIRLREDSRAGLAEAFLSNKKTRTRHDADALRIAQRFWTATAAELLPGVEPASPHVAGVPPIRVF